MIPPSTPNPGRSKPPRPRARNPSTSMPATKAITACLGFFRESGRRKGRRPRSQDRSEQKCELYKPEKYIKMLPAWRTLGGRCPPDTRTNRCAEYPELVAILSIFSHAELGYGH